MQWWLAPLLVLTLFLPILGWSADTNANAADAVMAACGKPKKDYTFPTNSADTYRTRFLSYKGETLWFTGSLSGQAWHLTGWSRTSDDLPFLDMGGSEKSLPCLKKVPATAILRTDPPRPSATVTPITSDNGNSEVVGYGILMILAIVAGGVFYFIPWMVAHNRKVNSDSGIIALNIFLGWTLVGWVAALVWASSAETADEARLKKAALENMARFNPSGKV
jgi:hypothetical protein